MTVLYDFGSVFNWTAPVVLNLLAVEHFWLQNTVIFLAQYVPYILVIIFILYALFHLYKNSRGSFLIISAISSVVFLRLLVVPLIHVFIQIPRPATDPEEYITPLVKASGFSFPSNHAMIFFALATILFLKNKKLGLIFYIFAGFVGVARIFAAVHYPFDIIAGALIGTIVAYFISKFIISKQ